MSGVIGDAEHGYEVEVAFERGLELQIGAVGDEGRRIAGPDLKGADLFPDYAARPDDRAFADVRPGADVRVRPQVTVGAYLNRFRDVRGEPPMNIGASHDMIRVANDAMFGDAGARTDTQKPVALNQHVITQLDIVTEDEAAPLVRAQDDVFPNDTSIPEFDMPLDFETAAEELHISAYPGALAPETPAAVARA